MRHRVSRPAVVIAVMSLWFRTVREDTGVRRGAVGRWFGVAVMSIGLGLSATIASTRPPPFASFQVEAADLFNFTQFVPVAGAGLC